MKQFFIFLFLLLFAAWIGVEIATDPGYILITRNKLAIEMPLWLAFLGLVISFIVFYLFVRCIHYFAVFPKRWKSWRQHRQQQKQTASEEQSLFAALYQQPQDWTIISQILPDLKKKSGLLPEQIQVLSRDSHANLLKETLQTNPKKFSEKWQSVPARFKKEPVFLNLSLQALIQQHEMDKAEALTRKLLKKHWLPVLIQTYGLIRSNSPERQLEQAEKWLKHHPHDPNLLLSLGRICKQLQLWGKARDYLETSLIYDATNSETYQELGELFETLGDTTSALKFCKKALKK
jgi:HemY protein